MKVRLFLSIIILLLTTTNFFAQVTEKRTITGRITDATTGEPIFGASVLLKDSLSKSNIGTASREQGYYSLNIPKKRQTIIVSAVAYESQQIVVEATTSVVNIALKPAMRALEEVVVVGYGVQNKKMSTYASASVSSKEMRQENGKKSATWKRSGLPENSIRLETGDGDNDYLPLEAAQMAVQIDGFRVRVLMDCFFFNDKKSRLEGTFKLRLPAGASPYYFAFGETEYQYDANEKSTSKRKIPFAQYEANKFHLAPDDIKDDEDRKWGNIKEARIVSKQKAARAYEQTVSARIDPALMEWSGADMFSCRVFPLTKGKLHRIVIGYDLNMTEAAAFREYILTTPTVVKDFKLDVDMSATLALMPEILPKVETKLSENRMYFSATNPSKKEYTIHYNTVTPIMLSHKNDNYFAANYRINLPETLQPKLPEDAVFMLDLSLSSNPDKFNVWLKLMKEILTKNQDVIKRFSVLCFNIESFWWNNYYIRNNYYNVDQFLQYADTLALEGATDLGAALSEAFNPSWLKSSENLPKHIFLMSDADFNWGESNMQAFKKLIKPGDRIHTYKTGLSGTNAAVLDFLSKTSGGFSFTVTGEEEAELTAKSFRYRPWAIEKIEVEGVKDFLISGQPSQLYNGQKLIFSGLGKPTGNIRIKVNNGLESKELTLAANEVIPSDLSERIYGQLALSALESYGYETEEATESYATYFRVPNATMSFLMLDSYSDYRRFGISDDDAEDFVEDNTVEKIVNELMGKLDSLVPLGNGKTDFLAWLKRLEKDDQIKFKPDSVFIQYVNNLPEEVFDFKNNSVKYRTRYTNDQTDDEKEMLSSENIMYDKMVPLANLRKKEKGGADALKLLSSVIERNPGDYTALRDLAIKAIDWNMGSQAYSMMRRIIANRQYEAVAYLTAAQALEKSGNTDMAMIYYYICMNCNWDSDYGSFEEISALQCNKYLCSLMNKKASDTKNKQSSITYNENTQHYINVLQNQTIDYLKKEDIYIDEADVVIIVNWNTDNTDLDLHVTEPSGEKCYYGHRKTPSGGELSIDVTDGYGPEMYVLKHAPNGIYKVDIDYYSDDATKTSSKSKVYVDFYRNWGRPDEIVTHKTIMLENRKDMTNAFQFEVKKTINEKISVRK